VQGGEKTSDSQEIDEQTTKNDLSEIEEKTEEIWRPAAEQDTAGKLPTLDRSCDGQESASAATIDAKFEKSVPCDEIQAAEAQTAAGAYTGMHRFVTSEPIEDDDSVSGGNRELTPTDKEPLASMEIRELLNSRRPCFLRRM
jgi:hypothetical protein